MEKVPYSLTLLSLLVAGISQSPILAQDAQAGEAERPRTETAPQAETAEPEEAEAPLVLKRKAADYAGTEKDLAAASDEAAPGAEEAVIETSRPYLLPRLFTLPTAYSLQSYEIRFGGQGNIHQTLANMDNQGIKASASIGLGGIMELGYQLDEYYTVEDISDKILMGYFKLTLLKEGRFLPAASISASKNLRSGFHAQDSYDYEMDQDMYEVVLSKAFRFGDNLVSFHPGAQVIRDEVTSVGGGPRLAEPYQATKFNPRLGISWQSRPKTLFMYEFKMLNPTSVASLRAGSIETHSAMENNLGIRYYIRNWLCIDSGIRHYYDMETQDDEMKLHANFVGVVPLATLYDRVENYLKK